MSDDIVRLVDNKPSEIAQAVGSLRDDMRYIVEAQSILAEMARARYLALIRQGFSEEQALELCRDVFG